MAEERMLSDEILLGLIKANGGGGGTNDYNDLLNQPSINNTTLEGDMSAEDLGLATEQALSGKQDVLTAGDYIQFDGNEISVKRDPSLTTDVVVEVSFGYPICTITKKVDNEVIDTATINTTQTIPATVWDIFSCSYSGQSLLLKLTNLKASKEHEIGYVVNVASYASGVIDTQTFVEYIYAGDKLVIKSEMDTALSNKQDTLTFDDVPTNNSDNPVKSNGIYDALADKTDTDMVAADFNAGTSYTTGNYCVQDGKLYRFKNNHSGAWSASDVEEVKIAGELSSLKKGLTNVQSDVKLNTQDLTTPSRSINLMTLPITITKSGSSTGTVTNNDGVITLNGEFFNEEVITVTCADCIAPNDAIIAYMNNVALTNANISFYNGSTKHDYFSFSIPNRIIYTSALANVVGKTINRYDITFTGTTTLDNFTFSLMMVHNGQNVSTYTPYIPSVESRIEAVESGVTNINTELNGKRIRYDGGTAWPGTSLEFTASKGNDFAYHFVAIASTATDTTSQSGYLVIRNDGTVLIVDQIGSFTASYNGTTGVLTITLPSSGYWDYRFERVASRLG